MYRPAHWILVIIASMSSEESDKPAHMGSLPRAIVSRIHKVWNLKAQTKNKTSSPARYTSMGLDYCKFGNFREDFIFAKLRICEVS